MMFVYTAIDASGKRRTDSIEAASLSDAQQELLTLGLCVVIPERCQALIDRFDEVKEALMVDLVIEHRVTGRTLLHELGEDAALIGGEPIL